MDIQTDRPRPPRTTGKRERTKAQNRELILEAARRVFAERGFAVTTVRDIIGATGLASGTFYNYFKSKEEVFQAIRDESALVVRPLLRAARRAATTAEEFVSANFRTFFEFTARERATFSFGGNGAGQPPMRQHTPEMVAGFVELREDIEAAIAAKMMPPTDAAYLAAAMIGIAFEISDVLVTRSPPDTEGATAYGTRLVMSGLTMSSSLHG